MPFNPDKHHRRSISLRNHDYSSTSCYFITICTYQRQAILGEITDENMRLNACGDVVQRCWQSIPKHFPNTQLLDFVVMPNHLHGILYINNYGSKLQHPDATAMLQVNTSEPNSLPQERKMGKPSAGSLGTIVGSFKSAATRHVNILRDAKGTPLWQRNYYEHVIRNELSLEKIRTYVKNNPRTWMQDQLHPEIASKW